MTRASSLKIVEWTLLVVGVGLAAWCAVILVEARFTKTLAPPAAPVTVTMTLPGDDGTRAAARRAPTVAVPQRGSVLGTLEAPSLHLSAPLLEGSDDGTLNRGAGHIEDTPLPGQPGNIGVAGHRDTIFRPLRRAKVGDELDLETAGRVYHYRISRTLIVGPNDVYVLDPTTRPTLTLVTCYPFEFIGHAPKRFIVQAELMTTR